MTEDKATDVAVVIGRFQVNELHEGHLALIKAAQQRHPHLLILLGCKPAGVPQDKDNPLDYKTRQTMLGNYFPEAIILPIHDCREDLEWSQRIDQAIATAYPAEAATIYGGRQSCLPHYQGRHHKRELDLGQETWSGTEHRRAIFDKPPLNDPQFRAGVIFAHAGGRKRQDWAVDAALTRERDGNLDLCLVKRNTEPGWRFPGGFVEGSDPDLASAAKRELAEETGLGSEATAAYVQDFIIDDWRVKGSNAMIRSALFHIQYSWGSLDAQTDHDDVDAARWTRVRLDNSASLAELRTEIVAEHRPLFDALIGFLRRKEDPRIAGASGFVHEQS